MVNACDRRTKVRTKSRRGRSPALRDPSPPFAMPMRPLVGRGYAPDTRAVSEAVAPMVNACDPRPKSEEHTSELQSPMRSTYAVFCLKKQHCTTLTTKPLLCTHLKH